MALLTAGSTLPNSFPADKQVALGSNQSKNLLLDKASVVGSLPQSQLASGSLGSAVGKSQLDLINNNTSSKLAFLENPVSDVVKTLEMLKTGGQNNIVPFLRKVTDAPISNAQKKWLIQQAVNMVGGAKNFVRAVAPFAKALAPWLTRANLALLPLAVYEEWNAWFNTPVADGTLPERLRERKTPDQPVVRSNSPAVLTNKTPTKIVPNPRVDSPVNNQPTLTQPALNKPQPIPIPTSAVQQPTTYKPAVSFPTPAQQKAESDLKSAEIDVSMAKYWVDQDFSKMPVLGVASFKENVAKLSTAVRAYEQAAASKVQNLGPLLKSFASTMAQARDLLDRAPQREAQIRAAEQKAATNPSRLSGRELDFNNPESVASAIKYESIQNFLTNAAGISGLVKKGLIKQPEDFSKLFGQKTFLPEELKVFSKSLRNFIAQPGTASASLVRAAQFLYDSVRAFRDPYVSFDFPSADVLKQAGKPQMTRSNGENPETIPDPWFTPPGQMPLQEPPQKLLPPAGPTQPNANHPPVTPETSAGGNTPTNPPNGGGGSTGGSGRSGGPTGGSNPGNNPLPPGNKLSRFIATVIATKEGKELLGQAALNGFQAVGVVAYNAWPSVRTGPAIKNAHDEIISFLKNPSAYNKANYNEFGKDNHFPANNSGQILFDGVNKQLLTRLPPDLYDAALQNAQMQGYSSQANAKEGYWLDPKSNELKMNLSVGGKVMPITLRPPAFQDKKTENFKFEGLKWQDAKVLVPQPGYALKQGQLTIMSMQLGPSDGLHYKFYFGIDTERAITPLRFETFAAKGPKDKTPAGVGRAYWQQNIATILATGTTQYGGSKFGDAANPNQGNTSFSTLAVAQLVDRNTLGQIVYDHNSRYGEVGSKRALVLEVDSGMRIDFTGADGTKISGIAVDEWAAGNFTYYKVKLAGDGKAFKDAFQNLKTKNIWPPKIETLVKDPNPDKFKGTFVKAGYGVLGVEGASVEWDGQSWVGIIRMENPARNAADNPVVVPPELRVGTDAQGNPVIEPWKPVLTPPSAKPVPPVKLAPTNDIPKSNKTPANPTVQQQPAPAANPAQKGKTLPLPNVKKTISNPR